MSKNLLYLFASIFTIFSFLSTTAVSQQYLKACPDIRAKYIAEVEELVGDWHLSLLIMDENTEEFEERSLCIQGKLIGINSTYMVQMWTIDLPELFHQRNSVVDFPTYVVEPGVWLVQSPLGGEIKGVVVEGNSRSHILVMYCGWYEGSYVHLMTVAMTRFSEVSPAQRLHLLSLLLLNGYNPHHNKIISWRFQIIAKLEMVTVEEMEEMVDKMSLQEMLNMINQRVKPGQPIPPIMRYLIARRVAEIQAARNNSPAG